MQLVLPVSQHSEKTFLNMVTGENQLLKNQIETAIQGLSQDDKTRIFYVHGNAGVGKTHILLASVELATQLGLSCRYVDMEVLVNFPTEVMSEISDDALICIDNTQRLAESAQWQRMIFDLINQCIEKSSRCILFSANASVSNLKLSLPDLASRLTWGMTFRITELDDVDKATAMKAMAHQKGMEAPDEVVDFVLKRSNRNMHDIERIVEHLDKASLQHQRKLTIPFVKESLVF
ncbi:DnaA regulatory inactivator Hda [Agaribacter marinus]|uniref:DnaA regulatory inactivator Hda n=1 Tax=Agaribacter marinus TaxID=1431249 RepID=UPI0024E05E0C|nr:DnaA regulatory inactivator Hda [Agaribacter marinus]